MDREGMVDALSRAGQCVAAGGRLIDIHPTVEPGHVEVETAGRVSVAGDLVDDGTELGPSRRHAAASAAVAAAVARGWFTLEDQREFVFRSYAESPAALRAYVASTRTHSWMDERTERRAVALLRSSLSGRLWLREQVTIARLEPTAPS